MARKKTRHINKPKHNLIGSPIFLADDCHPDIPVDLKMDGSNSNPADQV
jgi:hypothetical protein